MTDFDADDLTPEEAVRWPLSGRSLYPRERWLWFERLWTDVVRLCDRYRLANGTDFKMPMPDRFKFHGRAGEADFRPPGAGRASS